MLKYLSSSTYRRQYDFLYFFGLMASSFGNISTAKLRQNTKYQINLNGEEEKNVRSLVTILASKAKTPETRIKLLGFIQIICQIVTKDTLANIEEFLLKQLHGMINSSKKEIQRNRVVEKKRSLQEQTDQAILNLRKTTSTKQNQPKITQNQTQHLEQVVKHHIKGRCIDLDYSCPENINKLSNTTSNTHADKNQLSSSSKSTCNKITFLEEKIILPYASFLEKLINCSVYEDDEVTNDRMQMWRIVNLLKSMLKVSQYFMQIMRYFQGSYFYLLLMISQIFHPDIKSNYQKLSNRLNASLSSLQKDFYGVVKIKDKTSKFESLILLSQKYEINSVNQIYKQICKINDSIFLLYANRHVFSTLKSRGIISPELISTVSGTAELVYSIEGMLNEQQKTILRSSKKIKYSQSFSSNQNSKPTNLELGKAQCQEEVKKMFPSKRKPLKNVSFQFNNN